MSETKRCAKDPQRKQQPRTSGFLSAELLTFNQSYFSRLHLIFSWFLQRNHKFPWSSKIFPALSPFFQILGTLKWVRNKWPRVFWQPPYFVHLMETKLRVKPCFSKICIWLIELFDSHIIRVGGELSLIAVVIRSLNWDLQSIRCRYHSLTGIRKTKIAPGH